MRGPLNPVSAVVRGVSAALLVIIMSAFQYQSALGQEDHNNTSINEIEPSEPVAPRDQTANAPAPSPAPSVNKMPAATGSAQDPGESDKEETVKMSVYRREQERAAKAEAENVRLRTQVAEYEVKLRELTEQIREKDKLLDVSRREVSELKLQRDRALEEAERNRSEARVQMTAAEQKARDAASKADEAARMKKIAEELYKQGSSKQSDAAAHMALADQLKKDGERLLKEADEIDKKGRALLAKANEAIESAKLYQEQLEAWVRKPGNSIKRVDASAQGSSVTYSGTTSRSVGVQAGATYESPVISGRTAINFNLVDGHHGNGVYSNRNTRVGLVGATVANKQANGPVIQVGGSVREQGVVSSAKDFTINSQSTCVEADLNFLNALNSGRIRVDVTTSLGAGENYVSYNSDGTRGASRMFPGVVCGNASVNVSATSANGRHNVQAGMSASANYRVFRQREEREISSSVEGYLRYRYRHGEIFGGFVSIGAQHEVMDIKSVPALGDASGRALIGNVNMGFQWDTPFATSPPKRPLSIKADDPSKKTAQ